MTQRRDQRIIPMLGSQLARIYRDPMSILGGIMDAGSLWSGSRRWGVLSLTMPLWLILVITVMGATVVQLQSGENLIRIYTKSSEKVIDTETLQSFAQRQLEKGSLSAVGSSDVNTPSGEPALEGDQLSDVNPDDLAKVEMLSNRIRQLNKENVQAIYRHAMAVALLGRVDEAEEELLTLLKKEDHMPSHAWLALRLLRRNHDGEVVDRERLEHHLQAAREWPEIPMYLLKGLSNVMVQANDFENALKLNQAAVKRDKGMNLQLAFVAKALKRDELSKAAAEEALKYYQDKLGTAEETDQDRISVAESYRLLDQLDAAILYLKDGISRSPEPLQEKPELCRALSSMYLNKYAKTIVKEGDGWKADLSLLTEAAKVDPNYNMVGQNIAALMLYDIEPEPYLKQILRDQMKSGAANIATYEFVGQRALLAGNWKSSADQWEKIIEKPSDLDTRVKAYNNLAMCLIKMDPPDNVKALKAIESALNLLKLNKQTAPAELIDSYGEVLAACGRLSDAITIYNNCLEREPKRLNTRQRLIDAYKKIGMLDLARSHEVVFEKIKADLEANPPSKPAVQPMP